MVGQQRTLPHEQRCFGVSGTGVRCLRAALLAATTLGTVSCAALDGYPRDPEDTTAVAAVLQTYFDPALDAAYNVQPSKAQRDTIVLSRIRAYDISFDRFEKELWSGGNSMALGGDFAGLALAGIATTVKNAATKTIYSAAGLGVLGAEAAINHDLFYQRTLPALIAQMEANRAKVKIRIVAGLAQDISKYSLAMAMLDLDDLKRTGSLPAAISTVTGQANEENKAAQARLQELRKGGFSTTDTSKKLRTWLSGANGEVDPVKWAALKTWMDRDQLDPILRELPQEVLIDLKSPAMEAARQRVIADLRIQ